MAESLSMEPTATETADLRAEMKQAFAEMDRLRQQMRRDQIEIERSRERTRAMLDSLANLVKGP